MERPYRSPIEIPELVKEHLKCKSFCEIGCGDGDLLERFAKYATTAIGIEIEPACFPQLDALEKRVDNIKIIKGDLYGMQIPKCDVYYFWIRPKHDFYLLKILPPSTIIIHKGMFNKPWLVDAFAPYPGKVEYIEFLSNEDIDWPADPTISKDTPLVIGILHKGSV